MLIDPSKEITDFHIINENIIELEYAFTPEFEPTSISTNIRISSFCTCWARLKLWSELNKLNERVLYYDTDSIIYLKREGFDEYLPKVGEYLGQLTNELSCKEINCERSKNECEGHWITEFVSCGPKNYGYKLNSGEYTCKIRGFSLNYTASKILNFESMKKTLFDWYEQKERDKLVTVTTEIRRKKHAPMVYTQIISKKYDVVYDKRQILNDYSTTPFGYIRS